MTDWMVVLLVTGAAWLGYVYVGYPLLLALLALGRRRNTVVAPAHLPYVSVLIAARNEEKDIGWKIEETLKWDYPADRLEILIASDASDDGTDAIVKGFRDARVRLIRLEQRAGKGRALNVLAPLANGELFFFTDANAHVLPDAMRRLASYFADPRVGCVTGDSQCTRDGSAEAISGGASLYWGYESFIKRCEHLLGSVLVCDGAIFCIRKSCFTLLDPELANDLELPIRIGATGLYILHEPRALVIENETSSPRQEFARRRRISGQGALAAWKLRRALTGMRAWQFTSHKTLRWMTLVPMVLILIATVEMRSHPAFFALLLLQAAFYTSAAAGCALTLFGLRAPRLLSAPFYIVLGTAGCIAGLIDALKGRKYDIWDIPTLSRGQMNVLPGRQQG